MTTHRSERVGDRIRSEIARLLREEVRDPRIGFVTVTEVQLSPDLKNAKVYVSLLGDERALRLDALNRAVPFLRRGLARSAGLRFTPQLRFAIDESLDTGMRVEGILDDLELPDAAEAEDEP